MIGECASDSDADVCTPGLLIECHPKPQLATALIDAFLPSFSREPLVIYPIKKSWRQTKILPLTELRMRQHRSMDKLDLANLAKKFLRGQKSRGFGKTLLATGATILIGGGIYDFYNWCMEDIECQNEMKDSGFDEFVYDLEKLVYDSFNIVRKLADETIIFVSESIEEIRSYFTATDESIQYESPVGIVTSQQTLNSVQKHEVVQIVEDIVQNALENINEITVGKLSKDETDTLKEKILISILKAKLTPLNTDTSMQSMVPRSFNDDHFDKDDILEEIKGHDMKIRKFKFSDTFKDHLDKKIAETKSLRKFWLTTFLIKIAKMKKQAIVSTKEAIAYMLGNYETDKNTTSTDRIHEEGEPRWLPALAYNSWTWLKYNLEGIPKSCICLYPKNTDAVSEYLIKSHKPCSQPIPWCFVGSQSACPDIANLQQDFSIGGIQLWYSRKACINFKKEALDLE